jgi:GNAT superfamily N-acetyltransferase
MTERAPREGAAGPPAGTVIRSIRPSDAAGLRGFHARLSDDTIRNRFFGPHAILPAAEVRRFTSVSPEREVALVATIGEDIVGVGRFIRLGGGDAAEVAFVIQDGYQGRGLGTALLTRLAGIARADGIHRFVADTFVTNRPMLDVFMHTPAVAVTDTRRDGSVVHLVMVVQPAVNLLRV